MSDYIQIAWTRGNVYKQKNQMLKDDFYTLCLKDLKKNIGLRKKSKRIQCEIVFLESDVTLDYLCSDFTRFCLSFYKNTPNLHSGMALFLIPKQPIPISQELKEYIKEFLPDYYGIRK